MDMQPNTRSVSENPPPDMISHKYDTETNVHQPIDRTGRL